MKRWLRDNELGIISITSFVVGILLIALFGDWVFGALAFVGGIMVGVLFWKER